MLKRILSLIALLAVVGGVHAADNADKTVRAAIHSLLPLVVIDKVVKSDLPGFYEVVISGQIVYVTADGKYLLQGNLYDVPAKKDLTQARIAAIREQAVKALPASKQLIFAAKNPKHTVTVFTDLDCPYCRAFNKNLVAFNKAGISVDYVMFPLDIHPGAQKAWVAVWCSDDRKAAFNEAMNGKDPGTATCANPVAETKALGLSLGISATPTVLAEDGTSVDLTKAQSPQSLMAELDRLAESKIKSDKLAGR
ncbi:MAG: DsbC family protein [Rudaea sp.]